MTTARLAARAARLEAALSAAVTWVTAALPMIGAQEAAAALETAVPVTMKGQGPAWFLEELAGHMTAHPDALTSGSSLCPLVLLRLAHVLHEAGHPVVRPGCAHCGKVTASLRQLREEGRVCSSCASRSRKDGTCGRCGAAGVLIVARRQDGGICGRCYRRDPEVVEACAECGRLRNPVVRLPGGGALCHACWKRPRHTCVSCGETAPAALLAEEGAYCLPCYDRHRRPLRQCGKCGRTAKIKRNARDGQPDLCDKCYRGPEQECSRCRRVRSCVRVTTEEPICHSCYARDERPRLTCARCRRDKPVNALWPVGPVCHSCYSAVVRAPAQCARCRQSHPLIGRDADGAGICGTCAGSAIDFTCRRCGRSGYPYGNGGCAYFVLADNITELLTGPTAPSRPNSSPSPMRSPRPACRSARSTGSGRARPRSFSGTWPGSSSPSPTTFWTSCRPATACTISGRSSSRPASWRSATRILNASRPGSSTTLSASRPSTRSSSARSCIGPCCAGLAAGPPSARSPPR